MTQAGEYDLSHVSGAAGYDLTVQIKTAVASAGYKTAGYSHIGMGAHSSVHIQKHFGRMLQICIHAGYIIAFCKLKAQYYSGGKTLFVIAVTEHYGGVILRDIRYHLGRFIRGIVHEDHFMGDTSQGTVYTCQQRTDVIFFVIGRHYDRYHGAPP